MQCISISSYDERLTPKSWNFPNITRPFSIIYYALGGSAFYEIDGVENKFKTGHLYIMPANKVFSLREDENDKFYAVYIHAFTSQNVSTVIDVDTEKDTFLYDILCMIRKYIKETDSIYVHQLTDLLLSYVFSSCQSVSLPLHTRIREYIDANFIDVLRYDPLSEKFNYSPSHISRVFKDEYDLTPKQYARSLVLKEAVLLLNKGMSVNSISEKLHFSSPENFSRFFKNCYGCAPSEYIRKYENFPI